MTKDEYIGKAFDVLNEISVRRDDVERMAVAKDFLRKAVKAPAAEPAQEKKTEEGKPDEK